MATIHIDDTEEVLSHADDVDEEDRGYIAKAVQHVHSNPVRTMPYLI